MKSSGGEDQPVRSTPGLYNVCGTPVTDSSPAYIYFSNLHSFPAYLMLVRSEKEKKIALEILSSESSFL